MSPGQTPRVSVVLPVYNGADFIAEAVASVVRQSLTDWELIVVDDGSTDGTVEQVRQLARAEPRIRLLETTHGGIVPALNAGLAAAAAPLIARMDADDRMHERRLELQAAELAAKPHLGLVACQVDFLGDRDRQAGYALHVDWLNTLLTWDEIRMSRFVEAPFAHPSVMFRREVVAAHGAYRDGDFPEDYELWLRWMDAGVAMEKVAAPLLEWRDRAGRLSRMDSRYSPDAFFRTKAPWIARELARIAAGREVWVWGAGRPTRKRARHLEAHGVRIAGYIDIDPKKQGNRLKDRPVLAPGDLPAPGTGFVLGYVASRGARQLVGTFLVAHGFVAGRDFLMCA